MKSLFQKWWIKVGSYPLVQLAGENRRLLLLMVVVAFVPLFFSSFAIYWLQQNLWFFELPTFTFFTLFTLAAVFLIGFALTPSTVVAILSGYYLGISGLIPIFISYPLAALIGLFWGRLFITLCGVPPFHSVSAYQPYMNNVDKQQFNLVAYLRLSPVMPFAMINVFLATLPIRLWKYVVASMVGMLPRTLVFFWGGMHAKEVWGFVSNPNMEGIWRFIPFILILIALFGLIWVGKRIIQLD